MTVNVALRKYDVMINHAGKRLEFSQEGTSIQEVRATIEKLYPHAEILYVYPTGFAQPTE